MKQTEQDQSAKQWDNSGSGVGGFHPLRPVSDPVTPAEDILKKIEPVRTKEGDPKTGERIHTPPTS